MKQQRVAKAPGRKSNRAPARDLTWDEVLTWIARPWREKPCDLFVVDVWPQTVHEDPRVCNPGALRVCGEVWLYFEHRPDGLVTWWGTSWQGEAHDFEGLRKAVITAWKIHDKQIASRAGYVDDEEIPGF